MPLLILGLVAAGFLLFTQAGRDATKAVLDRAAAISSPGRGGQVTFFPVADSEADTVITAGMPVWVYAEDTGGTQAYYQLVVTTIPPTGQIAFGLSDNGDPVLETYLPRSHFAVGEPKAS